MKLLTLLLTLLIAHFAFANTFIVTSNAQTGPGSLDNALIQAAQNGTSTRDTIAFNLPHATRADRTISVSAPFSEITGNLVIDGTTQPGAPFGVSNAKVELDATTALSYYRMFHAAASSNIEIYGLYLNAVFYRGYAFEFEKVSHFVFGAPGKGNLVSGFTFVFFSRERDAESRDFIFRGNMFGTNETGTAIGGNLIENVIDFENVKDITIGGNNQGEGNLICARLEPININFNAVGTPGFLKIYGNKIGTDITGSIKLTSSPGDGLEINGFNDADGSPGGTTDLKLELINNIIACSVSLMKLRDTFIIKGNRFGLGADNITNIAGNGTTYGLGIKMCGPGTIGGTLPEDQNYFANHIEGIFEAYTGSVTILQNSFRCNTGIGINLLASGYYDRPQTFINITSISASGIAGNAPPNATIQLYYNDDCGTICEGKTYLTSAKADASGKWSYQGVVNNNMVATATDVYGATSGFSHASIDETKVQVTNATCGKANGSIKNLHILSGTSWHWEDDKGNIISHDTDLTKVSPGIYRFVAGIGNYTCLVKSAAYTIGNLQLPQATPDVTVTHISCGQTTGALSTPDVQGFKATWKTIDNIIAGTGFSVDKLPAARYYLKLAAINDASCNQEYGPFEIFSTGVVNTLDVSALTITNATCDKSNGNIGNIHYNWNTASSPIYMEWDNEIGNMVQTGSLDLSNVPAGKYRLKVKDINNCDTIFTPFYTILSNGVITIDSSHVVITGSDKCGHPMGAITGLHNSNGETFSWKTGRGEIIGNQPDVKQLSAGVYTLTVENRYGCSVTTPPIMVPAISNQDWDHLQVDKKPGTCDNSNGYIHISHLQNEQLYSYRWNEVKHPNAAFSTTLNLEGIQAGDFYLYAKDSNGCEELIDHYNIPLRVPPAIDDSSKLIVDELCGDQSGAIKNILVDGGATPFTSIWKDADQDIISTNGTAENLPAGTYTMYLQDADGCTVTSKPFTVKNVVVNYASPVYKDQTIRRGTAATLSVINFQPGIYSLFDSPSSVTPVQHNTTGVFTTNILSSDKTFYVSVSSGNCNSSRTKVSIKVADDTKVFVPGAFTPNGDGRNDVLKPIALGVFSLEDFSVYNRFGSMIFHTRDINQGWKGDYNGKALDSGTYIWIIRGKDINGKPLLLKGTTVLIH